MINKVHIAISRRHKRLNQSMHQVIDELKVISQQTKDERLIGLLKGALNSSLNQHAFRNLETEWNKHMMQLYEKVICEKKQPASETIMKEWERLFINQETREKNVLEQIKIVKNFKDFLSMQSNMREQDIYLQEVSPYLANFPQKGIELPG